MVKEDKKDGNEEEQAANNDINNTTTNSAAKKPKGLFSFCYICLLSRYDDFRIIFD